MATLAADRVGSFSVVGGADANKFSITGSTLSFSTAPDFENPTDADSNNVYVVTVRATNVVGFADQTISVTVTNDTSDDVYEATVTAGGTSTVYDISSSGDNFSFTGIETRFSSVTYSGTTFYNLRTMTVNRQVTVNVDVRGARGGGGGVYSGGRGGRITGRLTLYPNTTYYLLMGGRGNNGTNTQFGDGSYGGGGAGGGAGRGGNGSSFGNGGATPTGGQDADFYGSGDLGDGGGGLSGIFDGSPSQSTAIVIAGGGGGAGSANGGNGGGGTGTNLNGLAGSNDQDASGGGGATTTAGGSAGSVSVSGGQSGNAGAAGRGGGGAGDYDGPDDDYEGGGGGGGGYYGGGGGGAHAGENDAGGGGGGSGYYDSSVLTNVGGQRGYNTGNGTIVITRV